MGAPRALNDISFNKTNGGLGRYNGSDDVISGLIFGGLGLTMNATTVNEETTEPDVSGFVAVDDNISYVRKFTYPEELADLGIVFTPTPSGADQAKQEAKNVLYYHITEFFRMNPEGVLYVMVKNNSTAVTEATVDNNEGTVTAGGDISKLQTYAGGNIRQIGVFNASRLDVDKAQKECGKLEEAHRPLSVVLTYNGGSVTDLEALKTATETIAADGRCNVSLLIGCDADTELQAALGNFKFYGCIGACIGAISKAKVHESIAWVGQFPLGLKAPALFTGNLIRNIATSDLKALNGNRCIFPVIHAGDADNYFNDSHTLDVDSSDYAYIENVRTIDKACRGIRGKLLPWLNSPLRVDPSNGQLESGMVSFLETTAGEALEEMEKAGELSGYKAEIDPAQNVLATSALEIVIKKVPVGVMRKVTVKIGYTTSLS